MSAKNRALLPRYINAVAITASTDIVGEWINIQGLDNVAFQAVWTGTPTGTFRVEVSEDGPLSDSQTNTPSGVLGPSTLTLPASMIVIAAVPGGSAGNFYFDFGANYGPIAAPWIRFSYIHGSSTGSLSVGASAKAI